MNRTRLIRQLISLVILSLFLAHATHVFQLPLLGTLEKKSYDFRVNLYPATEPDQRIVIVDIDERSLEQVGRWPWSRNVLAELVNNLFDHYHVSVTGFDVLFAEADTSSGLGILEQFGQQQLHNNPDYQHALAQLRPQLQYDTIFANALQNRNVIMGYFFANTSSADNAEIAKGELPAPIATLSEANKNIPFVQALGFGASLPVLQQHAAHGGFIDLPTVDSDGVIRAVPMLQRYGDDLYEALSLAMVRSLMQFPPLGMTVNDATQADGLNLGLEQLQVGAFTIPVDERGAALVPYRGSSGSFVYVSAVDVLNKTLPTKTLEDAIVLVGTTAAGLLDVRSTPVQNLYPGVEVHANLIAGILDGTIKQNPAYLQGVLFVSLIVSWILLSTLFHFANVPITILGATLLFSATFAGGLYAWHEMNIVLPVATQMMFIAVVFFFNMTYTYFVENRSKRQMAKVFRQYIPPELVDELDNENDYGMEGETREMSVMFTDIRGFTNLSESLAPKELTRMMNYYFSEMTQALQNHRGTIDKYIGDAIMAFWGAPLRDEKHAQHAMEASLEMIERLQKMRLELKRQGWPEINIGVGINSGPMFVGNIGSQFRMSYTVLGDSVNLGSRLESLSKRYGVNIIVSETTRAGCPDYTFRELDLVTVVGKTEPVTIYEPLGKKTQLSIEQKTALDDYQQALNAYRQRQWQHAKQQFAALYAKEPRKLYSIYMERCQTFIDKPAEPDWNGVYNHDSK
ncbi:MAG: adenylate/guanylate cyclase domain-containing protein [Gammaproteobacteria bacterium]|nr:adenylate/guanylate cyclase domain-containing protein [Gammaproteobacteria bacterium]